jgi:uncharacterized damage-inducible protein DinB
MFRQLDDFLKAYEETRKSTERVFAALTDHNLDQCIADGHRTLGHIAWHIVTSVPEMMSRTGLGMSSVAHDAPPPGRKEAIIGGYSAVASELVEALRSGWNDRTLTETDDMYGERWPRGFTLAVLLNHEIHHRGQMTVLLRQAGAHVPGIFGPSKEEWSQYGMEPPPY